MPLSLYSAWLNPLRMYGGNPSGGGILPPHLSAATYPSQQSQLPQHLNLSLNHLQGAAYPGHSVRNLTNNNFTDDDSDDDRSLSPSSPVHDLSKSQHGKLHRLLYVIHQAFIIRSFL